MGDLGAVEQAADFGQLLDDGGIGLPHEHAAEMGQAGGEDAVALHRGEDLVVVHAVLAAGLEVLQTIGRRAMHDAGAGVERDVFAEIHGRGAVVEGMAKLHLGQRRTLAGTEHFAFQLVALQRRAAQFGGEDQATAGGLHQFVGEVRMHVQRLVRGDGPRRRGPDHREAVARRQRRNAESMGDAAALGVVELEADVDRRRLLVLVFDLGLGQRRAAVEAPVHRLQALEQVAAGIQFADGTNLVGLVAKRHGQVGIVPVAEHAEADEILLLPLHLLGGKAAAQLARLVGRQVLAVGLLDLVFDGQAMAVPARHVGRIEAGQGFGADDDVLEDLVHRMADVNVAVGIGRAVVQHEARTPPGGLADLPVKPLFLPGGNPARLAPGQIAAHRERRVGHVEGLAIVSHSQVLTAEAQRRRVNAEEIKSKSIREPLDAITHYIHIKIHEQPESHVEQS